jgi:hypothetical protein
MKARRLLPLSTGAHVHGVTLTKAGGGGTSPFSVQDVRTEPRTVHNTCVFNT